jgi:hypothetical protein
VEISRFCFTPTVLRVAIREEVRFTNLDPVQHNVLGANSQWGSFQFLKPYRGKSPADWDTYRFMQAGVFPYVCTMHPGMVGTVVVGQTAGSVATSTMSPAVPIAARPARLVSESRPVAATDGWKAMAVAVPLVVVLLGLVLVEQRRDRWPEP